MNGFLFLSLLTPLAYTQIIQKEALVKIDLVWLKVGVTIPQELVATREYTLPITVRITEVEGDLKVFYLKGIRFLLDNSLLEYVPDTPVLLRVGETQTLSVKITPKFFAQQMAPGDIRDSSLRIDISYYSEVTPKAGQTIANSGYYSVFASIPVTVLAPMTYVHVQPSLSESYEPYVITFNVKVWVGGEGFIENAKVEVTGAPVQCYLLTTGKIHAGESKVISTLMNVSELGLFAKTKYSAEVKVSATTPWGYIYSYSYPVTIEVRPIRKAQVTAPSLAVANSLTPVTVTLVPPQESGESVTATVYWNKQLVYSGSYSSTLYVSLPEGEGELIVRVDSNKYTPATASTKLTTVAAQPKVSAWVTGSTLQFQAAPLYSGAVVEVRITDSTGSVVASNVYPAETLPKRTTDVNGATAIGVSGNYPLDLKPGSYTITVSYTSRMGSATSPSIIYEVASPSSPLSILELLTTQPLLLIGLIAAVVIVIVVIAIRRRG
ncbi:MAG: hypothetical protein QW291_02380 [Thermofilaceae archaeon]